MEITEKHLIAKFSKLLEKTDKVTAEKYRGIFYFIDSLNAHDVNAYELLKNEWQKCVK